MNSNSNLNIIKFPFPIKNRSQISDAGTSCDHHGARNENRETLRTRWTRYSLISIWNYVVLYNQLLVFLLTVGSIEEQIVQQKDSYSPNLAAAPQHHQTQTQTYTSQATKELDDLMASLSDFKVRKKMIQFMK